MIKNFHDKETKKVFHGVHSRRLPSNIQVIGMRKLWMLDAAANFEDIRVPPSNHLERLHKDREGQYSIRINKQWRICFEWKDGDAFRVEITDYH